MIRKKTIAIALLCTTLAIALTPQPTPISAEETIVQESSATSTSTPTGAEPISSTLDSENSQSETSPQDDTTSGSEEPAADNENQISRESEPATEGDDIQAESIQPPHQPFRSNSNRLLPDQPHSK